MTIIIEKSTEFSRDFEVDPKLKEGIDSKTLLDKTIEFIHEEIEETKLAIESDNFSETIDGFGDVAFIALNGIYKKFRFMGNTHLDAKNKTIEVMNRICDANLGKKHKDGRIKYINGKVQKPENWCPPQYKDLFNK